MAWQKQIGVDISLLDKVDPEQRDKQIFSFSLLTIMLIIIGLICTFSSMIYLMIIFHSWFISISAAIFFGLVAFNVYRMLVMTALDAYGTVLGEYMRNHEMHYFEHVDREEKFADHSDEKILEIVGVAKQKLRERPVFETGRKSMKVSEVLTMSIRVVILSILALTFATGIEIFMFRDKINDIIKVLSQLYTAQGDTWTIENILRPAPGDEFFIINSNSLLLVIDVLERGLGNWKILIDLFFLIVFLIPLALVFRSKEVKRDLYVKEMILNMVSITFYHYIHTQKYCHDLYKKFRDNPGIYRVQELQSDAELR